MSVMNFANNAPDVPPSTIYRSILNPSKAMSFDVLSAQQTPENVYPVILQFNTSGPIVRRRGGHGNPPCNSSCNPTGELPISCSNKINPHLHHAYDMLPVLFTVIPHHMSVDMGPHAGEGIQIHIHRNPGVFSTDLQCSNVI